MNQTRLQFPLNLTKNTRLFNNFYSAPRVYNQEYKMNTNRLYEDNNKEISKIQLPEELYKTSIRNLAREYIPVIIRTGYALKMNILDIRTIVRRAMETD